MLPTTHLPPIIVAVVESRLNTRHLGPRHRRRRARAAGDHIKRGRRVAAALPPSPILATSGSLCPCFVLCAGMSVTGYMKTSPNPSGMQS